MSMWAPGAGASFRVALSSDDGGHHFDVFVNDAFHSRLTPVHLRYRVSIRPTSLTPDLYTKALIAAVDEDGDISSVGGNFANDWVTARTRSFGRFFVSVDTTAPSVTSLDIQPDERVGRARRLRFKIKDDLSGIADYNGFIDGRWALFAYDAKRDMLVYDLDPALGAGQHELRIDVVDRKGNRTSLKVPFVK